MNTEHKLLAIFRKLPPEKQDLVLQCAEGLNSKEPKAPLHSLEGLWEDLNIDLSEEEINQARREMWGNFPRDIE
ncbi:MAG TPA: hypothetical protein VE783_06785 [Candidatus Limnocylindrales bacterium]|jgi:hypothetical protein|nr:hypothetical protein [Candidatus Limnocylindrales bacterium]